MNISSERYQKMIDNFAEVKKENRILTEIVEELMTYVDGVRLEIYADKLKSVGIKRIKQ